MPAFIFRPLIVVAAVLAVLGAPRQARADTITFDSTITTPNVGQPQTEPGFIDQYQPTSPGGTAFVTQGFVFGGFTVGVVPNSEPDLIILLDPSLCPGAINETCTDNGTNYLVAAEAFSINAMGVLHSPVSFQATKIFEDPGCDVCNDGNLAPNATEIRVTGFLMGVMVAQETFALGSGFQTYVLTDPDWASVGRTIIQPMTATGALGYAGIDNIVMATPGAPVPEPASLLLLATGLAGLAARLRATRKRP